MQQLKYKNLVWVDLIRPEREALKTLQKKYRFHDLDIDDCLSKREQAKVEIHPEHLFLIFKFPVYNKRTHLFQTEELNLFLGKNYIITVHRGKLKLVENIFQEAGKGLKQRKELLGEGTGKFLWLLLKRLFHEIFPMIDKMSAQIRQMERELFEENIIQNRLASILILKRNLINLRRILLPQRTVITTLEREKVQFLPENINIFFDDILDKIEKLIETTGALQELVESLRETNETMLTHSLNNTIKVLTVFSAVMLPLTFVTGFFGMNVPIPYENNPAVFWWILGGMGLVGLFLYLFFKWRKWI
jgi:magnesium transporter